jgi:hypothetical protein
VRAAIRLAKLSLVTSLLLLAPVVVLLIATLRYEDKWTFPDCVLLDQNESALLQAEFHVKLAEMRKTPYSRLPYRFRRFIEDAVARLPR